MLSRDKIEICARAAHEANRRWCVLNGDFSQPAWNDAPENIKASARSGVVYVLNNPGATPESQHNEWLEFKRADGWTYGPVKDVAAKKHPCMLPFDQLSGFDKMKDAIFNCVVTAANEVYMAQFVR